MTYFQSPIFLEDANSFMAIWTKKKKDLILLSLHVLHSCEIEMALPQCHSSDTLDSMIFFHGNWQWSSATSGTFGME